MPNSTIKFYNRSYCDKNVDGYTISGDYYNTENTNDRNKNTYATTDGSDTDGNSVDYVVDLLYERTIDTIVLKSNLKTFVIYYWDGATYQTWETYTDNDEEFLVIDVSETDTSKIKITATHTISANEEKRIYMFECTEYLTEIYASVPDVNKNIQRKTFENIYGGSIQVIKYANHQKFVCKLKWKGLVDAWYTAYALMKEKMLTDSYNIYIYYSDTYTLLGKDAWYLVNDEDDFDMSPTNEALTAGVNGSMLLKEC